MTKIEFLLASDNYKIKNLQSMIREVEINEKQGISVYVADNEWKVTIGVGDSETTLTWIEFLGIVHEFSKFVTTESQILWTSDDELDNGLKTT